MINAVASSPVSHFSPGQGASHPDSFHRELFIPIVKGRLVLLREETLSRFLALELETSYFFDIGEVLGRFLDRFEP